MAVRIPGDRTGHRQGGQASDDPIRHLLEVSACTLVVAIVDVPAQWLILPIALLEELP